MAVARARYDGLRRNALYAIGSARDRGGPATWSNGWPTDPVPRRARRRRLGPANGSDKTRT